MKKSNIIIGILVVLIIIATGLFILALNKSDYFSKKTDKPDEPTEIEQPEPSSEEPITNDQSFTVNFIKKIYEVDKDKDIIISPYSMERLLNMLQEASDGDLKKEINRLLNNRTMNKLKLKSVLTGDSIFVNPNDAVKEQFVNIIKNNYDAEVFKELKADLINNWVSEKTNKMIDKVIDDSELIDASFALFNAIYMDAKWEDSFDPSLTKKETFTKKDGSTLNVDMMHKTFSENAKYLDGETKGVILPYQDNELEFIGLLPDDIDQFINNLNDDYLNNIDNNSKQKELFVSLPKFKYEYENRDLLNLFEIKNDRDLKVACDSCYLSLIFQKAKIELDEEGTKAAAVSGAVAESYAIPTEIVFNKPFVYLIRDTQTKNILFFGVLYELSFSLE